MLVSPVQAPLRITQHFGSDPAHYNQYGLKGHDGVDITGPQSGVSVPVYAPCDGTVVLTAGMPGYEAYGLGIEIMSPPDSLGRRRVVILGHNASCSASKGQFVHQGDKVAMMGATGAVTGLHCHLGLRFLLPDGSIENFGNGFHGWLNPEPYIRFWLEKPDITPFIAYPNG